MWFCRQPALITRRRGVPFAAIIAMLFTLATASVTWAVAPKIQRVTRGDDGEVPLTGAGAASPSASGDGRYVAFTSNAFNLGSVVRGTWNVFVKDRQTGNIELINRTIDDRPAAGAAEPAVSADGRFVAFRSGDSNLVAGDTNGYIDVFVRDRLLGTTERVNVGPGGVAAAGSSWGNLSISADGRYVAFLSEANNLVVGNPNPQADIFVRDRVAGTTEQVSPPVGSYVTASLSMTPDGRFVAFSSLNPNGSFPVTALLVRDRSNGSLDTVSVSSDGVPAMAPCEFPSISADGRLVTFTSWATNLSPVPAIVRPNIFLRDRLNGTTALVSYSAPDVPGQGDGYRSVISPDGSQVAFTSLSTAMIQGESNYSGVLYLREVATGAIRHADVSSGGAIADRRGSNEVRPAFSGDGRFLLFQSDANNLDPMDQNPSLDVFARDLIGGSTTLVSTKADGTPAVAAAWSGDAVISADGSTIAFRSNAHNLTSADQNHDWDVFVTDRTGTNPELITLSSVGVQAQPGVEPFGYDTSGLALSADGRFVAFISDAPNLVPDDQNGYRDVFVRDRLLQTTVRASVTSDGVEADGPTSNGARMLGISADGRYVTFVSYASNLVPGDTNNAVDVFVRDLQLNVTERVSVASDGSQANLGSDTPSISADGHLVAFRSSANSLVPGNSNGASEIYVRDRVAHVTERVSLTSTGARVDAGATEPVLSGNGRYVAFVSADQDVVPDDSNGMADVFLRDRLENTTELAGTPLAGKQLGWGSLHPSLSADGRYVTYVPGGGMDNALLLRDRLLGKTQRLDQLSAEFGQKRPYYVNQSSSAISGDGRFVAFVATGNELDPAWAELGVDVWVRDRGAQALAPTNLTAGVENGKIRLTWLDQSEDETGFKLQRRKDGEGFQDLVTLPAGSTGYLDTVVEWDTPYTYRVLALSSNGDSEFSNEASALVAHPVLAPPTDLAASIEALKIRLIWVDQSEDETGFKLQRRQGAGSFEDLVTLSAGSTTYLDGTIDWDISYTYRVKALAAYGDSLFSNEATAVVPVPLPEAPADLAVVPLSQTAVRLGWDDVSSVETGFTIERSSNGGKTFSVAGTVGPDQETFTDTGLVANTSYVYRVKATNATGSSPYSATVSATTLPNPPAAPHDFYVSRYSDTQLRVHWNPTGNDETGFELERKAPLETYEPAGIFPAGSTGLIDAGLLPNQTYFYRVRAFNAGGSSAWVEHSGTTGSVPAGKLSIEKTLDFGTVRIGKVGARRAKVRNLSKTEALRVSVDDPAAPYTLTYPAKDLFIASRGVQDIWFSFRPTVKGKKTIKVRLVSTDPKKPTMLITLTGRGK